MKLSNLISSALSTMLALLSVSPAFAQERPDHLSPPSVLPAPQAIQPIKFEDDLLLMVPVDGTSFDEVNAAVREIRGTIIGTIGEGQISVLKVKVARGTLAQCESTLKQKSCFKVVQRNFIYQADLHGPITAIPVNDPFFASEWHLSAINTVKAWQYAQGAGTIIGVLDTGCKREIPELQPKTYSGWDAVNHTAYQTDVAGHGTQVATVAAAVTNNHINTASPARLANVYPVRVGTTVNTITEAAILEGLYKCGQQNIKILNISANCPPPYSFANAQAHPALHLYLQWYTNYTGGIVFNSAGNNGIFDATPMVPYLQVVSGIDRTYRLAAFSNYGNSIWFTCPAVNIYCSDRTGQAVCVNGTSFAAPQCAAVAALIWSANPQLTRAQVLNIMKNTSSENGGWSSYYGFGLPDATAAVRRAKGLYPVIQK